MCRYLCAYIKILKAYYSTLFFFHSKSGTFAGTKSWGNGGKRKQLTDFEGGKKSKEKECVSVTRRQQLLD